MMDDQTMEDVVYYNSQAWDKQVEQGNHWTRPVGADVIEKARKGDWEIVLTPTIPVPKNWFGEIQNRDVLCLAGGGGQQGPVLAAAGAKVTTFDNSQRQLDGDRAVAERDGLDIKTVQGDMVDLSAFAAASFDLIVNPCSVCFSPNPKAIWRECFRVLRPGGRLMAGFMNPLFYIFDDDKLQTGEFQVAYSIPYSDEKSLSDKQKAKYIAESEPFNFGHTLQDLIGGQIECGFQIIGFFDDGFDSGPYEHLNQTINCCFATLATKP